MESIHLLLKMKMVSQMKHVLASGKVVMDAISLILKNHGFKSLKHEFQNNAPKTRVLNLSISFRLKNFNQAR